MDISAWLRELGLERYEQAFREHAIDAAILPTLTSEDLKEIGVAPLGHRKRILSAIAAARIVKECRSVARVVKGGVAQRRQLTIMFADVVSSTELSRSLDPEDLREINRAYQDAAKAAIERYGGHVAKYLGDGVLAYFGYPRSHEDDAERAIRAGHDLVATICEIDAGVARAKGASLHVRVAVETGPVVVGDIIGEGASQENAVVGETPNLAARLLGVAGPDELVVGPRAHALAGGSIRFTPLGPRTLKGFGDPVEVWRLDRLGLGGGRFERSTEVGLSGFVGRAAELGALAEACAQVRAGENVVAHVVGEAGIGKSRLVHEFLQLTASSVPVLTGHCASHGGTTAFFPFIDLLKRAQGLDEADVRQHPVPRLQAAFERIGLDGQRHVPYLLNLLGLAAPEVPRLDPDLIGVRTQEALVRLVHAHGQARPAVLYINDLHWIDERSEAVLDTLVRDAAPLGVLILCTFRPEYRPPWGSLEHLRTVPLGPLSADDSAKLFSSRTRVSLHDRGLVAMVLDRAAGNPLFVEELARHVESRTSQASSVLRGGVPDAAMIPDTLAGLLLQRVDTLSSASRDLLQAASVAGRRFRANLVTPFAPSGAASAALRELEDSGLIVAERTSGPKSFRFKHALVQDAVYGSLLGADRRALHRAIGEALERAHGGRAGEIAEELARHFEIAELSDPAARYAFMAGEKALVLFALRDDGFWFGMALQLLPDQIDEAHDRMRARAVVNQIQVFCWDCQFARMVDVAESHRAPVEALGEVPEVPRVLTWIGEGYMHVGRFADAEEVLRRALAIGEKLGDPKAIGYALGELLWLRTITSGAAPVREVERQFIRLMQIAREIDDSYLATLAYYTRWADFTHRGRIDEARRWAEACMALGHRTGYPPALCWGLCMRAHVAFSDGHHRDAETLAREAQAGAQCAFDRQIAEMSLGFALVGQERLDEGIPLLSRAQRLGDGVGAPYFAYAGEVIHGRALAAAGDRKRGLAWLRASRAYFLSIDHRRAAALASLAIGELEAVGAIQRPCAGSDKAGDALQASEADTEAARHLQEAIALAKATAMDGVQVQAHLMLAKLTSSGAPGEHARRHLDAAERLVRPLSWAALQRRVDQAIAEARGT